VATITVPGILDRADISSYDISGQGSFWVTRAIDMVSPQLHLACTNGTPVGDVTLVAGGTYVFSDAVASGYANDDDASETVTFNYTTVQTLDQ
jgi:type VI protein secretion system component Hcp